MAKKSTKTRKAATKRSATPKAKTPKAATKARTGKKSASAKAKRSTTAKARTRRKVTPKAKSTRKATAKAGTSRKTASAKAKRSTTAKAKTRRKATPKAETTHKATTTTKAKVRTRNVARKTVRKVASRKTASRTSKAAPKQTLTSAREDFDFNAWLLPSLELEHYEPHIAEEAGVQDSIKGSTRYAWIGAGQCGGRIVKSFHDLGYKKVLAVNTTHHDLDLLEIPQNQKYLMDIGEKGAGKDMARGRAAVQQCQQEVLHLTRQTFGSQVDHIMVCVGAGGGTGGGSAAGLIEIAKRYARYIGLAEPDKKVGAIMTLPTVGEASSPLVAQNAHGVACELSQMASKKKISPLIIVDNEKINKLYPGMTVKSFWPSINSTVAGLFDIFNRLSALSSRYTSFDPVDYHSITEAGGCAIMGLTRVNEFNDKFAISKAVKRNLEKTLLANGFNLSTAKVAGCIVVGGRKLMAEVKGLQDNINYAFDVLSEITGKATIHRGIYDDQKNSLRVYTIIGGLDAPARRLEELTSYAAVHTG